MSVPILSVACACGDLSQAPGPGHVHCHNVALGTGWESGTSELTLYNARLLVNCPLIVFQTRPTKGE